MGRQGKDATGAEIGDFCPPAKGSIEGWLSRITEIGGVTVELDGRTLPRVRAPREECWLTLARAEGFEHPGLASVDELARFVLERDSARAVLGHARKRPGGNRRICLEASYSRWIEGRPLMEPNPKVRDISDDLGLTRPSRERSARRVARKGDELWAALGAWP